MKRLNYYGAVHFCPHMCVSKSHEIFKISTLNLTFYQFCWY